MKRRFFHYTSFIHWARIEESGLIMPTESNLSVREEHAGPDVVWLTDDPRRMQSWMSGSVVDKGQVRITVDVEDAHWWPRWARDHGIDLDWYRQLDAAGGYNSQRWYVVERPIGRDEWVLVETGE